MSWTPVGPANITYTFRLQIQTSSLSLGRILLSYFFLITWIQTRYSHVQLKSMKVDVIVQS